MASTKSLFGLPTHGKGVLGFGVLIFVIDSCRERRAR
jgi:hypothetical protein